MSGMQKNFDSRWTKEPAVSVWCGWESCEIEESKVMAKQITEYRKSTDREIDTDFHTWVLGHELKTIGIMQEPWKAVYADMFNLPKYCEMLGRDICVNAILDKQYDIDRHLRASTKYAEESRIEERQSILKLIAERIQFCRQQGFTQGAIELQVLIDEIQERK